MSLLPCLLTAVDRVTGAPPGRFGDPLLDAYLEFLVARVRPNSVLAAWYDVAQRLNNRPRKILGWRTPAEVFQPAVPEGLLLSTPGEY